MRRNKYSVAFSDLIAQRSGIKQFSRAYLPLLHIRSTCLGSISTVEDLGQALRSNYLHFYLFRTEKNATCSYGVRLCILFSLRN